MFYNLVVLPVFYLHVTCFIMTMKYKYIKNIYKYVSYAQERYLPNFFGNVWCLILRIKTNSTLQCWYGTPVGNALDLILQCVFRYTATRLVVLYDNTAQKLKAFLKTLVGLYIEWKTDRDCFMFCQIQHWDVFDPYRGMKRRRQKQRRDAADTHGELFAEPPPQTVRKPVKNPTRYTKNTPKIIEVSTEHKQMSDFVCFSSPVICPIAIAYSVGQIIASIRVSVCVYYHARIFNGFSPKLAQTWKPPKVKTNSLAVNIAAPLPPFCPKTRHWSTDRRNE